MNYKTILLRAVTPCLSAILALQTTLTAPVVIHQSQSSIQESEQATVYTREEQLLEVEDTSDAQSTQDTYLDSTPATEETEAELETDEPIVLDTSSQEGIARYVARSIDPDARAGSRIYYPYPSGAMAVDLYLNGTRVLRGQVAEINGTIYVPVQRFADMFGYDSASYDAATETVKLYSKGFELIARVGQKYITVNQRIFYTGKAVLSLGGWIFAPLESMAKAFGVTLTVKKGYYEAYITGSKKSIPWADAYYDSTDLYWLSRIISAEAKGEPFEGQIAVGNVVLNRKRSSEFPNTVKGVIFDKKYGVQFSPVSSGTIYNTPTSSAVMAAKICLEGYSLSTRALYFYNPKIATSSWIGRTRPYIMTIGNHKFYA
ncbi:MAG: cell wall hydrolase [Clostridia bacterium]|nr:cell wall hydrolase [Clostridia bacterium]